MADVFDGVEDRQYLGKKLFIHRGLGGLLLHFLLGLSAELLLKLPQHERVDFHFLVGTPIAVPLQLALKLLHIQ